MMKKIWDLQGKWANFCERHGKGFDLAFGIAFAGAYAYYFFITSMITNICPEWLMNMAFSFSRVATLAGIVLATMAVTSVRNKVQMLIEGILFVFFIIYYIKGYYHPVFSVLMYSLAATNRSSRKIVWTTTVVGLVIMGASIILYFMDILPKVSAEHGDKHALGMIYYTDAGAHILHLVLGFCFLKPYIHKTIGIWKKIGLSVLDIAVIGGGLALAVYTGGRNNMVMLALLLAGTFLCNLGRCFGFGRVKIIHTLYAIIGVPLGVLLSVFVYLVNTVLKWEELPFDSWLSHYTDTRSLQSRIEYGRKALSNYPYLTLFGNHFEEGGNGGIRVDEQSGFFIDSSYLRIPLLYGFGIFLSFLGMTAWYQIRNLRKHRYYIMFLVMIALLSGVVEHHLLDFSYMFFIFLTFTREEEPAAEQGETVSGL